MTIPTLPSAPLVTDIPADFNTKAFNWVAALDNWTTEANATGVAADADAATATSAAGTATTQAGTATTQAGIATSAASTATTQAGIATTKAGEANASAIAAAASAASINLNSIDINGGTIDGTVIGGTTPAAVSATTLNATGAVSFGDSSTPSAPVIKGSTSGTGGGGGVIVQNGVSSVIAIGNKSSLLGGAYDATPLLYGNAPIETNVAFSSTGNIYHTNGTVQAALSSAGSLGVVGTLTNHSWQAIVNSAEVGRFSSTGLAVTGALSASGSLRGGSGATYQFALDYAVSGDIAGELSNSHASGYGYRIKGGNTSNYALLVQSQDSTNILEAKKGAVAVTGALSATGSATTVFGTSMSAGQTFGPAGTGGGVFINTPSLSANYNAGLAIDGSYAGGIAPSIINLKALGIYSGGGYVSNLAFWTSAGTTASEKMRLDHSGNLGLGVTPVNAGMTIYRENVNDSVKNALTLARYTDGRGTTLFSNYSTAGSAETFYIAVDGTLSADATKVKYRIDSVGVNKWFGATTSTQILAIEPGKSLSLQGATSVTGCGISFPATQVASSNANTLDDYEEGTWTPTQGAGLTVVGAFSSSGSYTKIGRQVTAYGQVAGATSVTAVAGTVMCGGLPFTAALQYQGAGANSSGAGGFVVAVAGTNIYSVDASSTFPTQCFSVTYTV